ncbi:MULTISPECIES: hypothetical protein [unclassified Novosphingobium]|uniref:hypothetical protein n=1 Tax=unclassified Novosphingobium TaxID=2644732 RepID=UPI0025DDC143|nr:MULTISPECIES: hypothetical protein [unclassified Novosphingobium]HQV05069.1 hypothetical protein [Novosphingobium sp.]
MVDALIQLAGSVVAILVIALICWKMGLGGDVRIRDEAEARNLADQAIYGFDAVDCALDRAGIGALLRDREGRMMLLRRHGAHFASRLLDSHAFARLDRNFLTIGTGEGTFGQVTLDLGDKAQVWASSLRHIGSQNRA